MDDVEAPSVPVVRPDAVASRSTEPASSPVTVFVATPPETVSAPARPVTVPAPPACAKATDGRVVARDRVPRGVLHRRGEHAGRAGGEVGWSHPVSAIWAAAPWTTVKAPRVPVVSPAAVASIVTEPTRAPVIVFVATPLDGGRVAGAA